MYRQYTEKDVTAYYNEMSDIYKLIWDEDGSLHWGIFRDDFGCDLHIAFLYANEVLARKANIGKGSRILDIGSGCGTTNRYLVKNYEASVVGLDISFVRLQDALRQRDSEGLQGLEFVLGSARKLPFREKTFSHVWSQACFYYVPGDKTPVIEECYRVLEPEGILIFDDLLQTGEIDSKTRRMVFDRQRFHYAETFAGYEQILKSTGFQIIEIEDLTDYMKKTYECLVVNLQRLSDLIVEKFGRTLYDELLKGFTTTVDSLAEKRIGWGLFLAKKK